MPALLGLALALRLPGLGAQSLWLDEDTTRMIVARPFGEAMRHVMIWESTPPLYYAAAWVATHAAGSGDAVLRSVSLLAGVAFVGVAYAYGRRLAGRGCGLALAALSAVHPWLVWYSQEARSYALAALLGALAWLAFLRVLDRPDDRGVLAWALAAGAAAVTHYTTAYFALAQGAWLFRARPRARRALLAAAAGLAVVAVALAPLVANSDDARTAWIGLIPLGDRLEAWVRQSLAGPAPPTWHPVAWIGACAAAGALLALRRADRRRVLTPALVAVGGVVAALVARELGSDSVLGRNLIFAWLPLAGVAAAGLVALPWPWLRAGAVAVACGPLLAVTLSLQLDDRLQRPDWQAVARAIGPAAEPRAVVGPAGWASRPLGRYLGAPDVQPPRPVTVREVVAVGVRSASFARRCDAGALCGMAPFEPGPSPVPGLARVSARTAAGGRFVLVTYRAAAPVTLEPGALARFGASPPGEPVLTFLQPPG